MDTRRTKNPVVAAAAAVALLSAASASAQSVGAGAEGAAPPSGRPGDVQVFGGVRAWANSFISPVIVRTVSLVPGAVPNQARDVEHRYSSSRISPIPFIGVRYGNFIGSISYMLNTDYDSNGLLNGDVRRDELDVNAGYYFLPQLAVSVGYKRSTIDKLSPYVGGGATNEVVLLGLSGSVPLEGTERLSLYGNAAFGIGRGRTDFKTPLTEDDARLVYRIGEIGLAYRLFSRPEARVKSMSVSLGYRAQLATYRNVAFGTYSPPDATMPTTTDRRRLQATTDGFVLGLVGVF